MNVSFTGAVLLLAALTAIPAGHHEREVETVRVINGTPEQVWDLFLNLDSVPEPTSPLLRLGFAHPLATKTGGTDRQCILSTGVMPERVTVAQRPHHFRFDVLETPPSMRETNPFGEVRSRHLREGYQSKWGEIYLSPAGPNRTKVIARSSYTLDIDPIQYWSLWSDEIVHQIHHSVLDEIDRRLSAIDGSG